MKKRDIKRLFGFRWRYVLVSLPRVLAVVCVLGALGGFRAGRTTDGLMWLAAGTVFLLVMVGAHFTAHEVFPAKLAIPDEGYEPYDQPERLRKILECFQGASRIPSPVVMELEVTATLRSALAETVFSKPTLTKRQQDQVAFELDRLMVCAIGICGVVIPEVHFHPKAFLRFERSAAVMQLTAGRLPDIRSKMRNLIDSTLRDVPDVDGACHESKEFCLAEMSTLRKTYSFLTL